MTGPKKPWLKRDAGVLGWLLLFWLFLGLGTAQAAVKNVILMIMDGCGTEQLTLARWDKGSPLALDEILVGAVKTHSLEAVITDSAAAATAYATGCRTRRGVVGLAPDRGTSRLEPRATILEGARLQGKATGIVVTSRLSHATPAAFYAHVPSRQWEAEISRQLISQNLTLALGGGRRWLAPSPQKDPNHDEPDLQRELRRRGYHLVTTREELDRCQELPLLGVFASDHLAAEIDRLAVAPEQPSLAEMTAKALNLLGSRPEGFFLLIEGSQIDFANHAHDPGYLLGELRQFDAAVALALDFARRDGQTLLVILADHNTGGFSLGNSRTQSYTQTLTPEDLLAPLRPLKASARRLWQSLGPEPTPAALRQQLASWWGLELPPAAVQELLQAARRPGARPEQVLGDYFCQHYTFLGWTTGGHTGGDVPLFAFGPERPGGLLDAPEVGRCLAAALGLNLAEINRRLFVPLTQALPGAQITRLPGGQNDLVALTRGNWTVKLLLNSNILYLANEPIYLEGLILTAESPVEIYLPRQALELLTGTN